MNRLAHESSPYLRQHRDNPVDWWAWGDAAFAEAKRRDVPVLLSVGYSACHWCHVMAHECFEDAEVAGVMNELFVNVKVDREERPDVDSVYMDAVQAMTGRGGWPMTVFLTPEAQPFFGGTYYPKPTFLQLMTAINDAWRDRRSDIDSNVSALVENIARTSRITANPDLPSIEAFVAAAEQLEQSFDETWGGFGGAPKFPSTMALELLLRAYINDESPRTHTIITTTLDAMASGGMYDHLGGGFARYSVDEKWLVPHFEKMLYDQALLLRPYLHASLVLREPRWRQVVQETIGYVLRDLRSPDGAFYSAEDADSLDESGHSHEGHFYVFTPDQVRRIIPEHLVRAETAHQGLTTLEMVATMHERKARMEELSDGFIVLPGGFGTFDEVFEILTWNQLGLISKPVVFLDSTGYYAPLFDAFDHMIAAGFVKENYRALLNRATTVDEAVRIASSPAPAVEGKLIELDITSKKTITS